jgi:hypothetical protein
VIPGAQCATPVRASVKPVGIVESRLMLAESKRCGPGEVLGLFCAWLGRFMGGWLVIW